MDWSNNGDIFLEVYADIQWDGLARRKERKQQQQDIFFFIFLFIQTILTHKHSTSFASTLCRPSEWKLYLRSADNIENRSKRVDWLSSWLQLDICLQIRVHQSDLFAVIIHGAETVGRVYFLLFAFFFFRTPLFVPPFWSQLLLLCCSVSASTPKAHSHTQPLFQSDPFFSFFVSLPLKTTEE